MKKQHKTVKAIISLLLVLFMMYSGTSIGVVAYATTEKTYYVPDVYYSASPDAISSPASEIPIEEYLSSKLIESPTSIDISSYYISTSKMNELASIIYDNFPEFFHISSLEFLAMGAYIIAIVPKYKYTAEEYTAMYNDCIESANRILSGIKDNDKLSDVEKALLLHDRIALLCEYDYENYQLNTIPYESYSMYGALVNGLAVCQGYAEAYLYLLRELGIDSYLCESANLNHAWNIVNIDGEEYHVDITWDDPVNDVTGRVNHDNFLRSSDGIYETGHTANDYITTPDSTIYDDYFWQDSSASFQLMGDEIYYIDETDANIKKYSDNSAVKSVSDIWMVGPTSYYPGCYARLSGNGTYLYYNSSQAVFEFNPETGTATEIWRPETEDEYFRIYGFKYEDDYLYCDLYSSPYFTLTTKADYQQKKFYQPSENVVLTGISINSYPDNTEYDIGDAYSSKGLSLLLEYSNGTSSVITEGFSVSGGDTSSEGNKTVTVTYDGFTTTYLISVVCKHRVVNNVSAAASTCKSQGHAAYSKCDICKKIISGSDALLPLASHNYIPSVTTAPTCTADGEKTFTCSVCSDSYTEAIIANGHSYEAVVTAPTCTEKGFTTYTCGCGDSYVADYVDATEHTYTSEITTPATHLTEGLMTFTCACGDAYTEAIEIIAEHSYKTAVTAPTCTEQGYTTYTCECGDSYVADYVDANGHTYTSEVTTPATHLKEGVETFTCECGDSYTEVIEKITVHSYKTVVTAPTCTEQGFTTYTCECGDSYECDFVDIIDHADADNDYVCDDCGNDIYEDSGDDTNSCSHMCHKTGFVGFFWKIINLLQRIFGTGKYCECGAAHY